MKLTGNTIFITGGGSGIGRGLAEALHALGNQVIISGRRLGSLTQTTDANPGMQSVQLDITNPKSIAAVAQQLITEHPALNVLINNAGVMHFDNVAGAVDEDLITSTITTNLMGPIRMTGALVEHLKQHETATIINVSSVLGFVPMATTAVYSSTKAAMHSYTQSLRFRLRDSSVTVRELAPPWVRTDLLNSSEEPRAMPLAEFISETMAILGTDSEEMIVERAQLLWSKIGDTSFTTQFNDTLEQPQ
ncbi:MAG: SDR family NAD(P)-dependent oxidoreductase [Capsulimonas sp.]|uniref:SDR family oxidoreductase n=1 Tax=Capsulimonas sp. TaxID=2494211 RepID=UPI003263E0B9